MRQYNPVIDAIELHILHHASEDALYGFWMIEELAQHGYSLDASQLYPRFHRLERRGHLTRRDRVVEGKLRKYYRITRPGRKYFEQQRERLMELISEALNVDELKEALRRRRRHAHTSRARQ